jgi:hypothetical protein
MALGAESGLALGADSPGNVHAKFFKGRSAGRRIWEYITKYVGKGFSVAMACKKSFATSKGIKPLQVHRYHSCGNQIF